jgi:DNA polymerase elongation subunit (family B)
MFNQIPIDKILFLDIETVPQYPSLTDAPEEYKKFWERKTKYLKNEGDKIEDLYNRAGIYAEFGKIICISTGFVFFKENEKYFKIKSFYGNDEKLFLPDFITLLGNIHSNQMYLCAHNGKEFDFPYIARRILINGFKLPEILNIAGKKPWESNFIDTMELWKFGDYKQYTSLNLLSYLFKLPSPKDDIDGSQVASVYYNDNNLERIVKYCQKDVFTVAQLLLKYRQEDIIKTENIEYIS